MLTAVLTGDVGAGKSTVVSEWRAMGATAISADDIAKTMWSVAEVREAAKARWGAGLFDEDDRPIFRAIADRVYASADDAAFANAMIHPRTRAEMTKIVRSSGGFVVAEIPLVFEAGVPDWADCVVYAAAPLELRAARNVSRGWDEAEIIRREEKLLPSKEKIARSDIVIANDGSLDDWRETARSVGRRLAAASEVCEMKTRCPSEEVAREIASSLVEQRLAACANMCRCESVYRWQGEVRSADEVALSALTTSKRRAEAAACVRSIHPYELPAITFDDLRGADFATLEWAAAACA